MNKNIIYVMFALSLTSIFCTIQPSGYANPTPDLDASVNATLTALFNITDTPDPTATSTYTPTFTTIATIPATGSIAGHLSYPSEFIPPLRVVAFDVTNSSIFYYVDTTQNQVDYTIPGLPAGVYQVISYLIESDALAGGYTQLVPCGLSAGCNDHTLIEVTVTAGETASGIDPGDWYAGAGAFPPRPNP